MTSRGRRFFVLFFRINFFVIRAKIIFCAPPTQMLACFEASTRNIHANSRNRIFLLSRKVDSSNFFVFYYYCRYISSVPTHKDLFTIIPIQIQIYFSLFTYRTTAKHYHPNTRSSTPQLLTVFNTEINSRSLASTTDYFCFCCPNREN